MEGFQDYLEQLYIATVSNMTLKEQREKELKDIRNELYVTPIDRPKFTRPKIITNIYQIS